MRLALLAFLFLGACNGCGPKPVQTISSSSCLKWKCEAKSAEGKPLCECAD